MLAEQRYQKIINLMQTDGSVKVADLKKKMGVSPETVRRDLENMEAQGLIRRTRGGAFLADKEEMPGERTIQYQNFSARERENLESKVEIAEFAVRFIKEGQSIALDSGTTAYELADAKGITLIATGGVYRPEEMAFVSDIAGMIFSKLSINTFFLTTCGISVDRGITYQRMDEIIVQEKMMEASDQTIVIADSTKLGVNSLVKMCDIDRVGMIITDSEASKEQIRPFEQAGISVEKPEN